MSKIKFVVCVLVLVSLASGLSVGCTASKPKPDKVTVQFNWDHTVEWAGFYAAKQQGYYANENLEVNLIAAEKDPVDEVVSDQIEFGTITGTGLVIARSQNKPIVAVAALLRRSPRVVMALASSGIATPKDLVGKKVGMTDLDTGWGAQFLTMLKQAGVDQKQIQFVPITEYGVAPLVRGEMDAIYNVWSTNEAIAAQLEGQKVNLIFLSDYDVLEYPDPLFTSEKVIQERPGVVERFVRATLKGCQYAVEHPTQAAQLALEYDKKLDLRLQTASMQAYVPLIDTGDAPIGTMDKATWQSTHDILLRYKFIPSSQDLNKLYTNDFVTKANPKS